MLVSRRTAILYDAECAFCRLTTGALLAWDRDRRLAPVALQNPDAAALLPHLTEEQRMESFHVVLPDERRYSGGRAFAPLAHLLPGGKPIARLAARLPRPTTWLYERVSAHRRALSKLIPGGANSWAERKIRERELAIAANSAARSEPIREAVR